MSTKKCQCGATPVWRVVRGDRRGRKRIPQRERLACPACGNQTAEGRSRELLSREWDSAGWCGQAEVGGLSALEKAVIPNRFLTKHQRDFVSIMDNDSGLRLPKEGRQALVFVRTDENGGCRSITRGLPDAEGVRESAGLVAGEGGEE